MFCKGAQGCVTSYPHFMYSNTANSSPFSNGPFIIASTCSPLHMCNNLTPRFKKREDCMVSWCKKGEDNAM